MEQNQEPNQEQQNLSSSKNFLANPKLPLIAATIVIILTVGVILLWQQLRTTPPLEQPTTQQISPPAPSPQPINNQQSTVDTSDWQTYRNEEFGFEVKYPKDWSFVTKRHLNNIVTIGPSDPRERGDDLHVLFVDIGPRSINTEAMDWIEETVKRGTLLIDGFSADYMSGIVDDKFGGTYHAIYQVEKDGTMFEIWLRDTDSRFNNTLNQILSTFRFVDEKNRQTTITPKNKEECVLQGGRWEVFGNVPGVSKEQCALPTSDAGTLCTNSSQCESICVSYDTTLSLGQEAAGVCYAWDFPAAAVWCSWFIEDGKATLLPCP